MKLSDIERRIIEHALGNPEKPYRDHYAAAADTEEYRACEALVGRGLTGGETVVVDGQYGLRPGRQVRIASGPRR